MDGNEFDELVDNLPWRLRNEVLGGATSTREGSWHRDRRQVLKLTPRWQRVLWWALLPVVYTFAAAVAICGIVLLVVPVVGVPVLCLAGYPGALHVAWRCHMLAKVDRTLRLVPEEDTDD